MCDREALQESHCELLYYIDQNAFLSLHCLFISTYQTSVGRLDQALHDIGLSLGKRKHQCVILQVFWRRRGMVVALSEVHEGEGTY